MSGRPERPIKRLRRLSSEYDDSEGTDDWMPLKPRPANRGEVKETTPTSRPRRSALGSAPLEAAAESSTGVDDVPARQIRLTVKMPTSKVTTGARKVAAPTARDSFEPGEILSGPRGTRSKTTIIEESDSEEGEEEESEAETEGESDQAEADAEADAEGELEDSPVPPNAKPVNTRSGGKPRVTVTPAKGKPKAARAKEIEVEDDDDEELSVLESDENRAEEKDEVDDEPENDEEGGEQVDEEEDESDDDATPANGSRASTPDMSKLTKRQRSRWEMEMSGELLQLPSEPKIKKILSAEEHAMRRAEMARRRKNLSEKRNEEEKMDTINKLLKKQAPKQRRAMKPGEGTGDATPNVLEAEQEKPKATMIRWISNQSGSRVGVPEEWLGTPVGNVLEPVRSEKITEVRAN